MPTLKYDSWNISAALPTPPRLPPIPPHVLCSACAIESNFSKPQSPLKSLQHVLAVQISSFRWHGHGPLGLSGLPISPVKSGNFELTGTTSATGEAGEKLRCKVTNPLDVEHRYGMESSG